MGRTVHVCFRSESRVGCEDSVDVVVHDVLVQVRLNVLSQPLLGEREIASHTDPAVDG